MLLTSIATFKSLRSLKAPIAPLKVLSQQTRMTENLSFMERWGHKDDEGAQGRQLRSSTTASSKPSESKTSSGAASGGSAKKRKLDTDGSASSPSKSHKSAGSSKPNETAAKSTTKSNATPKEVLIQLLSQKLSSRSEAKITDYAKSSNSKKGGAAVSSQSASLQFTPFEELLATVVVSRPIQHTLGHRAVHTLLNPPYDLRTPRAILDAGEKRVFEALEEAKTLHKDKTASQLVDLAHTVINKFDLPSQNKDDRGTKTGLEKLRRDARGNNHRIKEIICKEVNGLGPTGADIFLRRIQRLWGEFWPVVDTKTSAGLEALGLPSDANQLKQLVDECWDQLNVEANETQNEEEQKRQTFVEVLREVVDADLKGRIETVKAKASKKNK